MATTIKRHINEQDIVNWLNTDPFSPLTESIDYPDGFHSGRLYTTTITDEGAVMIYHQLQDDMTLADFELCGVYDPVSGRLFTEVSSFLGDTSFLTGFRGSGNDAVATVPDMTVRCLCGLINETPFVMTGLDSLNDTARENVQSAARSAFLRGKSADQHLGEGILALAQYISLGVSEYDPDALCRMMRDPEAYAYEWAQRIHDANLPEIEARIQTLAIECDLLVEALSIEDHPWHRLKRIADTIMGCKGKNIRVVRGGKEYTEPLEPLQKNVEYGRIERLEDIERISYGSKILFED